MNKKNTAGNPFGGHSGGTRYFARRFVLKNCMNCGVLPLFLKHRYSIGSVPASINSVKGTGYTMGHSGHFVIVISKIAASLL